MSIDIKLKVWIDLLEDCFCFMTIYIFTQGSSKQRLKHEMAEYDQRLSITLQCVLIVPLSHRSTWSSILRLALVFIFFKVTRWIKHHSNDDDEPKPLCWSYDGTFLRGQNNFGCNLLCPIIVETYFLKEIICGMVL